MAKYKTLSIDLYKRDITIFIGNHDDFKYWVNSFEVPSSWERLIESIIASDEDGAIASYWYNINNGNGIIELPYHPEKSKEIAVAAHECLHATFHIADYVGLEYIKGGSNESFTYLHEYILENVLDYNNYETIKL